MSFISRRRLMGLWAQQSSAFQLQRLHGTSGPPIDADKPASPVLEVYLWAVGPPGSGFRFLDQVLALRAFPCVIGRHRQCDYRLACQYISRRHCGFSVRDGKVWVEDLGSSHGTCLNGEPVVAPRRLQDGDRLVLACLPFEVRLSSRRGQARM
jgi:hypothetical protein